MAISVVLAEDNSLLRQGLVRLIEADSSLQLVGTATDLPSLLEAIDTSSPEVVVSDIRMPPSNSDEGIQVADHLRAHHPETGLVLLSQFAEAAYALALLSGGAARRAYLLKERVADVGELTAAIKTVAAGGSVIDPTVVDQLVSANTAKASVLDALSPREREVLSHMAQGKSNAAIAGSLFLSERAIEKHTNSIFTKLNLSEEKDLNRRVRAVLLFLQDQQ